jgi:hypothetical protein
LEDELNTFSKKSLAARGVALRRQQKIDRLPGRIHSPVQILVLPLNLYIGLVDTVALVSALEMRLATPVQLRRIDLHPTPNTTSIHFQASFFQ